MAAVKDLTENGYDFAYIHVEAPDEMGHQGNVDHKVQSIENLDSRVIRVVIDEMNKAGEDFRLLVMPGILLTPAYLLGIRDTGFAGLISVFASATAIASFTMTQQMGGDAELAGDIVVSTSALCIVTMFAWSVLFKALGAF